MSLFDQLDVIIESAVRESMQDERKRQKHQAKVVDKLKLRASDKSANEVEEADDESDEKEKSDEKSFKLKGTGETKGVKKPKEESEPPGTPTSKKLKDPTEKQIKNPDFKSIAGNINLLRGGKSIKDPEVRKNLKDYIEKLDTDERRQVLVYLNSLAQVMAGTKSGDAASDPEQAEKKAAKKQKKAVKKSPKPKKTSKTSDVIVVGA